MHGTGVTIVGGQYRCGGQMLSTRNQVSINKWLATGEPGGICIIMLHLSLISVPDRFGD